MIEIINKEQFKTEIFDFTIHKEWIFDKKMPIILNFFAPWCGPCHQFAPTLEEIASEHSEKLKVYKSILIRIQKLHTYSKFKVYLQLCFLNLAKNRL